MKVALYLRTSTKEQHPENQREACLEFAKARGYEIIEENIFLEKLSGFKDIERPKYELIKEKARKGEIKAVIVWALDRWVRNRDTLIEDVTILRNYGCKLHSVKEAWLEAINIEGSLGKTIQEFLLGLMGSLAEMESQRKSERVKIAFDNHKGNKWGRKNIPNRVKQTIVEAYKANKPYSQICLEVSYNDSNNNKKFVSKGFVHKTIKEFKQGKLSFEGVQ